jgi:hypothetical protein
VGEAHQESRGPPGGSPAIHRVRSAKLHGPAASDLLADYSTASPSAWAAAAAGLGLGADEIGIVEVFRLCAWLPAVGLLAFLLPRSTPTHAREDYTCPRGGQRAWARKLSPGQSPRGRRLSIGVRGTDGRSEGSLFSAHHPGGMPWPRKT